MRTSAEDERGCPVTTSLLVAQRILKKKNWCAVRQGRKGSRLLRLETFCSRQN